ncbi:MAG: LexA repressor [Rhodobacterales bacterium]|nr:MAG: LexA repressor [Rhodobacterales bacterium]
MKVALNLKSKSGIHRLISALEERGFLRRLPHRARSIEILKSYKSISKLSESNFHQINLNKKSENNIDSLNIPLVGNIAAGLPIDAIYNENEKLNVPNYLMGKGNYFALNIIGDSMIDIGINEGDIAIIKQKNDAKDGDLVVALIDDTETTLKRFRKNGKEVVLEAENKNYKSQVYKSGSNIKIQGILSGLIRRYN